MLRNLASSLFLTERETFGDLGDPKVKGRVVTTLEKAKEVRPLVEKCITIARRSISAQEEARQYESDAQRGSSEWRSWRGSQSWQDWNQAIAPVVAARRRALRLLGSKQAVSILFEEVAPRFADRPGGYTRVVRLAHPRLGDAGTQAVIEFVGVRDRAITKSEAPTFDAATDVDEEETSADAPSDTAPDDIDASTDDNDATDEDTSSKS